MSKLYAGRRKNVRPTNLSLDISAAEILDRMAPSAKTKGWFVARLLYEHQARQEERERIETEMKPAAMMAD